MNIKKKIVLSVSIFVAMLVALVTGIICLQKPNSSSPVAPGAPADNGSVQKPTTYTYQAGQIELAGTNQTTIDFKYEPSANATDTTATVKAYEYIFGRPESVEEMMAVTLKPVEAIDGVDISYVYSDEALDFSDTTTTNTKFEAQTIDTKGADIYIYILVSPSDATLPVDFTTTITWNFGNAGTLTYNVNGEIKTETIVKGQELPQPEIPTAPTGYYFDAWFTDANFTQLASFPHEAQGQQLYARFHNFPLNSTTYMTYTNGSYSVTGNPNITDLTIPTVYNDGANGEARVTTIGDSVFSECYELTSIDLPSSLTAIGDSAFYYCSGLTSIDLSGCTSLTSIGTYAFQYCNGLTSIDLSKCASLTSMGDGVFSSCDELTSIDLPSSITSMGDNVFFDCYNLTSIDLPSSITSIGYSVFQECYKLTSIDLSKCTSLTSIGGGAFDGCYNLTSIDLSKCTSLTSIGDWTFEYCGGLTTIDLSGCTSLTSIGDYSFQNCTSLTSLELPNSLTSLGAKAFNGCTNLTNVDLSNCDNLTYISDSLFKGCTSLTSMALPNSITGIGDNAFSNSGLTSMTLPSSLTTIGEYAFSNCTNLISVDLTSGLTSIGEGAFNTCSSLTDINLGTCTNLTIINDYTFENCSSLTSIVIPSSVTKIGTEVFIYSGLTSATFEDISTWYEANSLEAWNNCDTTNATEIEGLTLGASFANANALTGIYSYCILFRVD